MMPRGGGMAALRIRLLSAFARYVVPSTICSRQSWPVSTRNATIVRIRKSSLLEGSAVDLPALRRALRPRSFRGRSDSTGAPCSFAREPPARAGSVARAHRTVNAEARVPLEGEAGEAGSLVAQMLEEVARQHRLDLAVEQLSIQNGARLRGDERVASARRVLGMHPEQAIDI